MSFSHLAITTKDLVATHRFYTEAVGFALAKVDVPITSSCMCRRCRRGRRPRSPVSDGT